MEVPVLKVILCFLGLGCHLTEGVDPCTGLGGAVALGMESTFIQSTQIKASSTCNCTTHPPEDARYMYSGSWTSAIADDMQFLQIDLEIRHYISSVRIQGRPDYPQFVRTFNLEYSNDPLGYEFDYVPDDGNPNIAKELVAITLADDIDYATYIASHDQEETNVVVDVGPLRFVRFYPTSWTHHIAMRVELLGCTDVDTTVQVTSLTETISGNYGQTFQFECQAQGYRAPSTSWLDPNGDVMENDARIQITKTDPVDFMFVTSTLTINYFQESDKGDYSCNATHEQYLTSNMVEAVTQVASTDPGVLPTLDGTIDPAEVKFYNNYFYEFSTATSNLADASQHCIDGYGNLATASEVDEQHFIRAFIATPNADPDEKYWVDYPGAFNAAHGKYSNTELSFSQLPVGDPHRYVCKYGEVTVTKSPLPSYPLWTSSSFEVICYVTGNPEPSDVKWYKNGVEMVWDAPVGNIATLTADSRFTWDTNTPTVHKLTISAEFQLDDLAAYRCEGSNGYSTAYEEYVLPPGTFPHLLVRHSNNFGFGAVNAQLSCEAACYPHASLHWQKDGTNITVDLPHLEIIESVQNETSNIMTVTLQFDVLVAADVGLYVCVVENNLGPSRITFEIPSDGDVSDDRDLSLTWFAVDRLVVEDETGPSVLAQVSDTIDADENRSLTNDELTIGEHFLSRVEGLSDVNGNTHDDLHFNLKNVLNVARGLISINQVHQTQPRSLGVILSAERIYTKTAITLDNGTNVEISLPSADALVVASVVTPTTEYSATFANPLSPDSTPNSVDESQDSSYSDGRYNSIELDSQFVQSRYLGDQLTFSTLYFNEVRPEILNERKRRSVTDVEPVVTTQLNSGVMSCRVTADGEVVTDIPVDYTLANKQDVTPENIDVREEVNKRLIYMHEVTTQMEAMCRFWNYANDDWDAEGVNLVNTDSNEEETTCHSTHTTNFAVLMQVTEIEISSTNAKALEIITYIGCGISIATLLFTIILFQWLDTLRSERTTIHKNLIIAIILAQVVFLAGINATHNWVACMCVALILHFCYLAVFAWMLVEENTSV
ncbi:uncharacterized protein [Ptychodera flava]|uniref:uncharacterized protein isoform X2 n=1 Tax=Ptychodera flava TaxID=63121 RepID=UPI00396A7584